MAAAVVLMAKNPIPGFVKTRLAKDLGQTEALSIYLKLLKHTTDTMKSVKAADRIIYHSPKVISSAKWIPSSFMHKTQSEGHLGDRMIDVFNNELNTYDKVILIGADCMLLNKSHLLGALHKLDYTDVVLGPSEDGGYYLIGLKNLYRSIFENIDWSTEEVYDQTMEKIEKEHLSIASLPELYDIDYKEDWDRWQNESDSWK